MSAPDDSPPLPKDGTATNYDDDDDFDDEDMDEYDNLESFGTIADLLNDSDENANELMLDTFSVLQQMEQQLEEVRAMPPSNRRTSLLSQSPSGGTMAGPAGSPTSRGTSLATTTAGSPPKAKKSLKKIAKRMVGAMAASKRIQEDAINLNTHDAGRYVRFVAGKKEDPKVMVKLLPHLALFAETNPGVIPEVVKADGAKELVEICQLHHSEPSITAPCCALLVNVVRQNAAQLSGAQVVALHECMCKCSHIGQLKAFGSLLRMVSHFQPGMLSPAVVISMLERAVETTGAQQDSAAASLNATSATTGTNSPPRVGSANSLNETRAAATEEPKTPKQQVKPLMSIASSNPPVSAVVDSAPQQAIFYVDFRILGNIGGNLIDDNDVVKPQYKKLMDVIMTFIWRAMVYLDAELTSFNAAMSPGYSASPKTPQVIVTAGGNSASDASPSPMSPGVGNATATMMKPGSSLGDLLMVLELIASNDRTMELIMRQGPLDALVPIVASLVRMMESSVGGIGLQANGLLYQLLPTPDGPTSGPASTLGTMNSSELTMSTVNLAGSFNSVRSPTDERVFRALAESTIIEEVTTNIESICLRRNPAPFPDEYVMTMHRLLLVLQKSSSRDGSMTTAAHRIAAACFEDLPDHAMNSGSFMVSLRELVVAVARRRGELEKPNTKLVEASVTLCNKVMDGVTKTNSSPKEVLALAMETLQEVVNAEPTGLKCMTEVEGGATIVQVLQRLCVVLSTVSDRHFIVAANFLHDAARQHRTIAAMLDPAKLLDVVKNCSAAAGSAATSILHSVAMYGETRLKNTDGALPDAAVLSLQSLIAPGTPIETMKGIIRIADVVVDGEPTESEVVIATLCGFLQHLVQAVPWFGPQDALQSDVLRIVVSAIDRHPVMVKQLRDSGFAAHVVIHGTSQPKSTHSVAARLALIVATVADENEGCLLMNMPRCAAIFTSAKEAPAILSEDQKSTIAAFEKRVKALTEINQSKARHRRESMRSSTGLSPALQPSELGMAASQSPPLGASASPDASQEEATVTRKDTQRPTSAGGNKPPTSPSPSPSGPSNNKKAATLPAAVLELEEPPSDAALPPSNATATPNASAIECDPANASAAPVAAATVEPYPRELQEPVDNGIIADLQEERLELQDTVERLQRDVKQNEERLARVMEKLEVKEVLLAAANKASAEQERAAQMARAGAASGVMTPRQANNTASASLADSMREHQIVRREEIVLEKEKTFFDQELHEANRVIFEKQTRLRELVMEVGRLSQIAATASAHQERADRIAVENDRLRSLLNTELRGEPPENGGVQPPTRRQRPTSAQSRGRVDTNATNVNNIDTFVDPDKPVTPQEHQAVLFRLNTAIHRLNDLRRQLKQCEDDRSRAVVEAQEARLQAKHVSLTHRTDRGGLEWASMQINRLESDKARALKERDNLADELRKNKEDNKRIVQRRAADHSAAMEQKDLECAQASRHAQALQSQVTELSHESRRKELIIQQLNAKISVYKRSGEIAGAFAASSPPPQSRSPSARKSRAPKKEAPGIQVESDSQQQHQQQQSINDSRSRTRPTSAKRRPSAADTILQHSMDRVITAGERNRAVNSSAPHEQQRAANRSRPASAQPRTQEPFSMSTISPDAEKRKRILVVADDFSVRPTGASALGKYDAVLDPHLRGFFLWKNKRGPSGPRGRQPAPTDRAPTGAPANAVKAAADK